MTDYKDLFQRTNTVDLRDGTKNYKIFLTKEFGHRERGYRVCLSGAAKTGRQIFCQACQLGYT